MSEGREWPTAEAFLPERTNLTAEAEVDVIQPLVIVALGATAARAIIGRDYRVSRQRGGWVESEWAEHVTATVHPSSILRQQSDDDRRRAMDAFVNDLEKVARVLNGG